MSFFFFLHARCAAGEKKKSATNPNKFVVDVSPPGTVLQRHIGKSQRAFLQDHPDTFLTSPLKCQTKLSQEVPAAPSLITLWL